MVKAIRLGAIGGLALTLAVASTFAAARPIQAPIPGVTVEATATPVRWLGLIPSTTVRFEITIYVDDGVRSFSAIQYECRFVDPGGVELGLASRGVAARDTFTVAEKGRLVSRAREELMDREPAAVRCRATKLEIIGGGE
jgi:hypothetical protein